MRTLITIFAILLLAAPKFSQAQTDFFERTQLFLETYVADGQINYSALVESPADLDEILYDIAHMSLDGRSQEYKAAFYINAYNILVIKNVVNHWPISSPLDVDGFFENITFEIATEKLSLNDIENIKLRQDYTNPGIHFALVCAGNGCPPLESNAILPGTLAKALESQTRTALNTDRMVAVDTKNKVVHISKIFQWYPQDFGASDQEILDYISSYRNFKIPIDYSVKYLDYDWSLNGF